jgi:hypothetical protein
MQTSEPNSILFEITRFHTNFSQNSKEPSMPKNEVSDPITDQEIAFAHLVLSGAMTDRRAAEAVGLNPDAAAYTKAKPSVRAYILEHRSAGQQQLVQREADGLRRLNPDREQVLARLWEIANLSPEMTRGSVTGQVKALSMIVAMENLIPDRRAVPSEKKSPTAPTAEIYASAWRRPQQDTPRATTSHPQPGPASNQEEGSPAVPEPAANSATDAPPNPTELSSRPERSVVEGPAVSPGPSQSTFANRFTPSEAPPPYVPLFNSVPDLRVPFSIKKNPLNPFVRPR